MPLRNRLAHCAHGGPGSAPPVDNRTGRYRRPRRAVYYNDLTSRSRASSDLLAPRGRNTWPRDQQSHGTRVSLHHVHMQPTHAGTLPLSLLAVTLSRLIGRFPLFEARETCRNPLDYCNCSISLSYQRQTLN